MLLEPMTLRGGAVAPNRVWLAPMTNGQSLADGSLGDHELHWLGMRADGGFGVVETCAAFVAQDGKAWDGELGVDDDAKRPGMRRVAERIATTGALGLVQLFHGGVRAPRAVSGSQPWSASEWDEDAPGFERPRAATEDDLRRVIDQFAAAARRSYETGFAGVELHGAHGYLLSQFLSRTMNTRTDRWGGDIAGRARLIREVTRAVRAVAPPPFVVGVRLSPEDFVHLSLWRGLENTRKRPDQHAVPIFRAALPAEVRIVAAGSLWTRAECDSLLARGADAVAIARAAICNPDWPRRIVDAGWEPRRPPMTAAELAERGLSPVFIGYMRRWKSFVSE